MRQPIDIVNRSAIDPANPGEAVLEAIHGVMHLARSRQHGLLRDSPHALSGMEGKVLGFFARHPGATSSDLAAHTGRDKGQLARLIGGLRERGLLEAQADDADRRSIRLTLSAAAHSLHRDLQALRHTVAAEAVAGLGADEQRQLLTLLDKLRGNLEA